MNMLSMLSRYACIFLISFSLCYIFPGSLAIQTKDAIEDPRFRSHTGHLIKHGSKKHTGIQYSQAYHVPPRLHITKGGLELHKKKDLIMSSSIFIAYKLRHLFFTHLGTPKPNVDYQNLSVCQGSIDGPDLSSNVTQHFEYFACPTEVRGTWLNFLDDNEDTFCCGLATNQSCCNKENFYKLYGTPVVVSTLVIVVVIGSGIALLVLLGSILLCLKLHREKGNHGITGKRNIDQSMKPLIPYSPPTPVYPANQQTPIYPANQQTPIYPANQQTPIYPANQETPIYPANQEAPIYPMVPNL